jgi:hypothetical protein
MSKFEFNLFVKKLEDEKTPLEIQKLLIASNYPQFVNVEEIRNEFIEEQNMIKKYMDIQGFQKINFSDNNINEKESENKENTKREEATEE